MEAESVTAIAPNQTTTPGTADNPDSAMSPTESSTKETQDKSTAAVANDTAVISKEDSFRRRILIVEDDAMAAEFLRQILQSTGPWDVDLCTDGDVAFDMLEQANYSILLTDLRLGRSNGMDLLKKIQTRRLPVTVIVMTGYGSVDQAVQALKNGAADFLTKPIDVERLKLVVQHSLRDRLLQDEIAQLRTQLKKQYSFQNIISKNPVMHGVFELIQNVAGSNSTVLIEGETGTGKEQVARAIHLASPRAHEPLIAVNCAALPETLLESELFGHEKGSFTSAASMRRGRFELADKGTLFLDEVGDVPMMMQAKLLRVLQERQFERVGGAVSLEVDVRVIGATNRNLLQMVHEGTFREDLYYRLNVVKIDLPPLRERPEDIPLLSKHFSDKYARPGDSAKAITPEAMEALLAFNWPGNVRQLENAIERACVTSSGDSIRVENLPPDILSNPPNRVGIHVDLQRPLRDLLTEAIDSIERQYIRKAIRKAKGNVGRCARICGLSRRSITSKLAKYQLDKAVFKEV